MTGEFLFDELNCQAERDRLLEAERAEIDSYVAPPVKYKSEANRLSTAIMATLDCVIRDDVSDARYDAAQTRVEKIIMDELIKECEDDD